MVPLRNVLLLLVSTCILCKIHVDAQFFDNRHISPQSRNFMGSRIHQNYEDIEEVHDLSAFHSTVWRAMERVYPALARLFGTAPLQREEIMPVQKPPIMLSPVEKRQVCTHLRFHFFFVMS